MQTIGLFFSFLSAIMVFFSSAAKKKKNVFIYQTIDSGSNILANFFLQGYSGMIVSLIACLRNILTVFNRITFKIQIIFSIIVIIVGLYINNRGILGILPIISFVEYTLIAPNPKSSILTVKIAFLINVGLWTIYNFIIKSYPMMIANIICFTTCLISIYKITKEKQKKTNQK